MTVADCAHGPHEIRGCSRNDIVRELAAGLPAGTIHYNAGVSTVSLTAEGRSDCLVAGHDCYVGLIPVFLMNSKFSCSSTPWLTLASTQTTDCCRRQRHTAKWRDHDV